MFDLAKSSFFFEQMSFKYPLVVQHIDILNENKKLLDIAYHHPKQFILQINNLLRSLLFFIEYFVKNNRDENKWVYDAVSNFRASQEHERTYVILKKLRDSSVHQKLIVPDESLVEGLFRINTRTNYSLKLGIGDHNKLGSYSEDLSLKNTEDIFNDVIVFSRMFTDIEQFSLSECLGVTRRWFYKVNVVYKDGNKIDDVIDIYDTVTSFTMKLLDHVCKCYAEHETIEYDFTFYQPPSEHNNINTLLELDIYPSLFEDYLETPIEPFNCGVRFKINECNEHIMTDNFYNTVYHNLTPDLNSYLNSLRTFLKLSADEIMEGENFFDFISFIGVNYWHFKKASLSELAPRVQTTDIIMLQRLGNIFLEECRSRKLCTIRTSKDNLDQQIRKILTVLEK